MDFPVELGLNPDALQGNCSIREEIALKKQGFRI